MRVLSFTSLFPTARNELLAPFIGERVAALSRLCSLEVMSPIPASTPTMRVLMSSFRDLAVLQPSYLAFPEGFKRFDGFSLYLSCRSVIKRLHVARAFDIIEAHWSYPDGYAAVQIGRQLGIPVVVTVRGSDIHRFLMTPSLAPLVRKTLETADACIAVSDNLRKFALSRGVVQSYFAVIRNAVDPRQFKFEDAATARVATGIEKEPRSILYVGRLVPNKRLDILLSAVARLQGVKLFVIGLEDPRWRSYKDKLRSISVDLKIDARVSFVGPVRRSELKHWYCSVDCLCLFSDNEGCPNVILEANACGTPVVARAIGGVPELITHGVNGLLVDSIDPRIFASAIENALTLPWNRLRISEATHERTWDQVAIEVHDVLASTVERFRHKLITPT